MDCRVELQDSATEGPWPLPEGWAWARLGDLLSHLTSGSRDWAEYYDRGSKVFVMAQNIRPGRYNHSYTKYVDPPEYLKDVERSRIQRDDLLITIVGANTGDVCRVDFDAKDYFVCQSVALMRPILPELSAYLELYLVALHGGRGQMNKVIYGAGRPHLSFDQIESFDIPLPPLAEQRRIVARIDALFAEIAEGEAALAAARDGLDTFRRALLKAAVTGELTADWRAANQVSETGEGVLASVAKRRSAEKAQKRQASASKPTTVSDLPTLPETWAWATVGDLAVEMEYGTSEKCDFGFDGVPVLRMGNVNFGSLDYTKLKYAPSDTRLPILQDGDLVFNRTNSAELVGKCAVYRSEVSPCSLASYLIRVRFDGVPVDFVGAWINSPYGRAWITTNKSQQVGQANLSGGTLKKMPVPVPPPHEAAEILRRVSEALSASADTLSVLDAEATDAARLKQSILNAAFEGCLVPQDSTEEPAAALLERLATTAPAPARAKRGRGARSHA
ncbi:restriction endonuclease subunit S [Rhodopseudomonas palustris]